MRQPLSLDSFIHQKHLSTKTSLRKRKRTKRQSRCRLWMLIVDNLHHYGNANLVFAVKLKFHHRTHCYRENSHSPSPPPYRHPFRLVYCLHAVSLKMGFNECMSLLLYRSMITVVPILYHN